MDFDLEVAIILTYIIAWGLPLSLIMLIIGAVVDAFKKRFHWLKFALIFFVLIIILLIIEVKLSYFVTGKI